MWSRATSWRLIAVALAAVMVLGAAVGAGAAVKKKKRKPSGLAAPALQAPADETHTGFVPVFTWRSVRGAVLYEFQLSADGAFRSIVGGQGQGSFQTKNTAATVNKSLADGNYFWRVRAVNIRGDGGKWSRTRTLRKESSDVPLLQAPAGGATISYPQPLVLSWSAVPRGFKYQLEVATDPGLSNAANGFAKPVETSGTDFAVPFALPAGRYYWAVTPLDAQKNKGQRSAIGTFSLDWPSTTATRTADLNADERVYDPQLSWDQVPGAARYEVEISSSDDFAAGSKVCCTDATTGTSLSPRKVLPNNTGPSGGYFWRMRAIDVDGNAGVWNRGPNFPKYFSPSHIPTIPNLHLEDHLTTVPPTAGTPSVEHPVIAWDPAPGASSYDVQVAPTLRPQTQLLGASGTTLTVDSTALMIEGLSLEVTGNGGYFEVRKTMSVTDATHVEVSAPVPTPLPGNAMVSFSSGFCNWTPNPLEQHEFWNLRTASTAWTPLAGAYTGVSPVGGVFSAISFDPGRGLMDGRSYCARIRARTDRDAELHEVVSDWTELGDFLGRRATFEYATPTRPPCTALSTAQASDYETPATGESSRRLPFFTWRPIQCAVSYFVVVAKDEEFTDIVDIGLTSTEEYAPRINVNPRTYPDEASSYYWAVVPASAGGGNGVFSSPRNNAPQQFQKRSLPPTTLAPIGGTPVSEQPTFRWTSAEGAREYRLQVDTDPSFGTPIEDINTNATAYTTPSTYPADTPLYWRVRATDENKLGLTWSDVQTFTRKLPAPQPSPDNPEGGRTIPLLRWTNVPGAVSYDLHVDQPDGTAKDFTLRAAAFTPVFHYGTGVWRWKVRANFPKLPFGTTAGAYSESRPFTRFIGSPAATRGTAKGTRMVLSWDPVEMTKSYRVEISQNSSYTTPIETGITDGTSYAPRMISPAFADGGKLFWRVAGVDEGNAVGGYTTGTFSLPKRIKLALSGTLRRGLKGAVKVKVTDARGRKVNKAKVRVTGAGIRGLARRTSRRGIITFKLKPRRRGNVSFLASKGGYRAGSAILKVAQ